MKKLIVFTSTIFLIPAASAISFEYIKQSLEQTFSLNITILTIALVIFLMTLINYLHTRTMLKRLAEITEQFEVNYVHDKVDNLKNYISFCKNMGYKEKWIIHSLRRAGWQDEHINTAVAEVDATAKPKANINKNINRE